MAIEGKHILLITIILIITASIVWTANYKFNFNGFIYNDSSDYNQIARNIYRGNGFETSTLRPIDFLYFQQIPHPEVMRPPLYPYMLAGLFMLLGVNDFAVVICDGIFYIALVALTFLVAIELSKSYKIALFSAITVAMSGYFLFMSIAGLSDIVFACLFMFFLFFYLKKDKLIFWHGVIIGFLYLLRANTLFFVIPWLFIEFKPKEFLTRWRDLFKFSAGVLIVITSYLIRNYIETGYPIFSLHKYSLMLETNMYPRFAIWTQINDISAVQFLINHPEEIFYKVKSFIPLLYKSFTKVFHPVVIGVFLLTLVLPINTDNKVKRIRRFILWVVVLQTFILLAYGREVRFYLYLFPVIFILFGIVTRELLKSVDRRERLLSVILVIMSVILMYPSVSYWKSGKGINIYAYFAKEIKTLTVPNDVIASDIAWEISWYSDRKTIWLPYDMGTLNKISGSIPIDYVFFSVDLIRPHALYKDNIWQRLFLYKGEFNLPGYRLVKILYYEKVPIGVLYKVELNQRKEQL